jgi:hypothetical protein
MALEWRSPDLVPRVRGGSSLWVENSPAAVVAMEAMFAPPAEVALSPATVTLSAIPVAPDVPAIVTIAPASLTLSIVTVQPVPGAATITTTTAALSLQAQTVTPVVGVVNLTLSPVQISLATVAVAALAGASTVAIAPSSLTLEARPVFPLPQPSVVALVAASLTLTALPVQPQIPVATVSIVPALFTLTATPVTPRSFDPWDPANVRLVMETIDAYPSMQVPRRGSLEYYSGDSTTYAVLLDGLWTDWTPAVQFRSRGRSNGLVFALAPDQMKLLYEQSKTWLMWRVTPQQASLKQGQILDHDVQLQRGGAVITFFSGQASFPRQETQ